MPSSTAKDALITLNLTINKEPSLTKHLAYSSLQMRLPLAATF